MYKKDLASELNISSAKMGDGKSALMDAFERICSYMDYDTEIL